MWLARAAPACPAGGLGGRMEFSASLPGGFCSEVADYTTTYGGYHASGERLKLPRLPAQLVGFIGLTPEAGRRNKKHAPMNQTLQLWTRGSAPGRLLTLRPRRLELVALLPSDQLIEARGFPA